MRADRAAHASKQSLRYPMATRMASSSFLSPKQDPYELDRLAEELAEREGGESSGNMHPETRESETEYTELPELEALSHENEYLRATQFDVDAFLLSRAHTTLPDLRSELRSYLAKLKAELVKLINDDYEAFISLSTDLQDEGERLERIKHPLNGLRTGILESRNYLQAIKDNVKQTLDRRSELREEKGLLQLLLKISDSTSRLESLLLIRSSSKESSLYIYEMKDELTDVRENRAKHLLRIATEYNRLMYHTDKAKLENCQFVIEMQWRIDRIRSTLSSDLEAHFASLLLALTSGSSASPPEEGNSRENENIQLLSDLSDCLRAYDLLGLWRDAEGVIRQEVVRKFVKKTIYNGCFSVPHSPVAPRTPFSLSNFDAAADRRRSALTPYTPYVSFSSQQSYFDLGSFDLHPDAYLLDDSDNGLAGLYNHILRFIANDMKYIMDAAEKVAKNHSGLQDVLSCALSDEAGVSSEQRFEILSNVIWVEVSRALTDDLGPQIFAIGKLDEFHQNYCATQAFIRSLEHLAPSMRSVLSLRSHETFQAFDRRWQLPVYFQLRWKDIIANVEDMLETEPVVSTAKTQSNRQTSSFEGLAFIYNQTAAVWGAVCQCWSADIYLPELGYRFWRLTLQLIKRYDSWLRDYLVTLDTASIAKSPATDKAEVPYSRSATPTNQQEQLSASKSADEDKTLLQCANLVLDIQELQRAVILHWKQLISELLSLEGIPGDTTDHPEGVLQNCVSTLSDVLPLLSSKVEAILIKRCCHALAHIKGLPGQFRTMSQKHMPTKPSTFIPLILRPLRTFFDTQLGEANEKALRDAFCASTSVAVVEAVANKYMVQVSAMRKQEESLRRLRMGKRTGFSLFGPIGSNVDNDSEDEGRVRTQLILDVDAFGKDAQALEADLDICPSYQELRRLVQTSGTGNTTLS